MKCAPVWNVLITVSCSELILQSQRSGGGEDRGRRGGQEGGRTGGGGEDRRRGGQEERGRAGGGAEGTRCGRGEEAR